jgi:hypothetical protein
MMLFREGSRHGMPRGTGEGSVRGGNANAAAAAADAGGRAAPLPPPPPLPPLLSQLSEVQACSLKGRLASMLQGGSLHAYNDCHVLMMGR